MTVIFNGIVGMTSYSINSAIERSSFNIVLSSFTGFSSASMDADTLDIGDAMASLLPRLTTWYPIWNSDDGNTCRNDGKAPTYSELFNS